MTGVVLLGGAVLCCLFTAASYTHDCHGCPSLSLTSLALSLAFVVVPFFFFCARGIGMNCQATNTREAGVVAKEAFESASKQLLERKTVIDIARHVALACVITPYPAPFPPSTLILSTSITCSLHRVALCISPFCWVIQEQEDAKGDNMQK